MKAREFIIEAKKEELPKPRNFVAKAAQKTISGAGAHKDKKRAEKQGDVKHKKQAIPMEGVAGTKPGWMLKQDPKLGAKVKAKTDLAKKRQASYGDPSAGKSVGKKGIAEGETSRFRKEAVLKEDLSNFTNAGIPAEFAKNILQRFQINHDVEIESINGKPKTSDINNGDMIINLLPNGDVLAVLKRREHPRFSASYNEYYQLGLVDGKFKSDRTTKISDATRGMTARGKFFRISSDYLRYAESPRRGDKPTPDEVKDRSTNDPLAGSSYDIYSYMNDTFMPKMRQQMEAMVDYIYANLRKLDKNKDRWGHTLSVYSKNQQETAIKAAAAIEEIAEKGFTRNTMEQFLSTFGKRHTGFASIPNNESELRNILKNEPNARAKWAKVVMAAAKEHYDEVKKMISDPMMKALKGEEQSG